MRISDITPEQRARYIQAWATRETEDFRVEIVVKSPHFCSVVHVFHNASGYKLEVEWLRIRPHNIRYLDYVLEYALGSCRLLVYSPDKQLFIPE